MKEADKARILAKLDETPPIPKGGTQLENGYYTTPELPEPSEEISAIQTLLDELRADRARKEEAITRRLELAIAKEEAMERLLAQQKAFVAELMAKGQEAGELVDADEAAAFLKITPRSLRWYAEQKIIPSYPVGKRKRRYNKAEIKAALEKARRDGRIAHDPEVRRRILR